MDANNKELKTRLVFIDTCAFIGKSFNFGLDSLGRLQTYLEQGKVHLLIPDITKSEIEKHIRLKSEEAHKILKKIFKNDKDVKILRAAKDLHLSGIIEYPTAEEINENIILRFEEFIDLPNVELVSTEKVSSKIIFNNYFNNKPPFDNPKKKCEFPDAFVLEAINDISISRRLDLYVISSDQDLKSYADSKTNLIHLHDINNLNDLIIHNDEELAEPAKFADKVFDYLSETIIKKAKETLSFSEYDDSGYSEYFYDDIVQDVEIQSISISEKNIQDVTPTEAHFQVNFEVELTALIVLPDYGNSPYDPEFDRFINLEHIRLHKKYKKIFSAHISIDYPEGIKTNSEISNFSFDDSSFDLN